VTEPDLPTIDHLGFLEDLSETPAYLRGGDGEVSARHYSCAFCGLGDSGTLTTEAMTAVSAEAPDAGVGLLRTTVNGSTYDCAGRFGPGGRLEVESDVVLTEPGGTIVAELRSGGGTCMVTAREIRTTLVEGGGASHSFLLSAAVVSSARTTIGDKAPTDGCVKFRISLGRQRPVFPIHVAPSVLDRSTGRRRSLAYEDAVARFATLLLSHRPPYGRTLVYACGQVDYFTIFAIQEVFRLLGVRNLAGNAEHCLNAGAVHNEMLTGQEGPFLTVDQAIDGPGRFHLLNGWNGLITHPPAFHRILKRDELDAYLIEVATTESADAIARRLGPGRVLYVRSGGDPQLALAVGHEILARYPGAVDQRFVHRYADRSTYDAYATMAGDRQFSPEAVAARVAPEPSCEDDLLMGIRGIARRLVDPTIVPINIPSVGLSQTKGAVAHCLWGNALAMVGKYGLRSDGSPAGGTLRLPGQINAQTEVQGLSRRIFMGRIRADDEGAVEAARRMGLPDDAYDVAMADTPRAALDYSDETAEPELFVCLGTQFESNMMERDRWVAKLEDPRNRLVVIDPVPDPFTLERADLVIPSPPHGAAAKLYQNGEWRFSLSVPPKRAPAQTRTDATLLYDTMAEISARLTDDRPTSIAHPDLGALATSGYLRRRFEAPAVGGALRRRDGEVDRSQLWDRIMAYLSGGSGPLYCRPEHPDGTPLAWADITAAGSVVSGGVGTTRYVLDYDDPDSVPFRDVYRRPRRFTFFVPTEADLALPTGIVVNSGRSTMSDDRQRIRFATATFNSGKATPATGMPDDNPLHISAQLAARRGLVTGDRALVTNIETGASVVLGVVVSNRVKGEGTYVSFHKSRAELDEGRYLNTLTSHTGRCPYTSQSNLKSTLVDIERADAAPGAGEGEG